MSRRPCGLRAVAFVFAGALLCTLAGCAVRQSAPMGSPEAIEARRPRLDAIFDDVMARYRLPGLALGVVENGEVLYQRTAGELVAGSGRAIDAQTLFKIASNSKAMTTGVLARLVDAGKVHWSDPVTRHLPQFRMHDPWVTREMQVRDLLIHNSGLRAGAGDLMLWPEPNHFTRADIIAGLAHLQPVRSFRSGYDYDNLLYIVAGEVAAAAAGMSYEEAVQRELFAPLGMTRCRVGEFHRDEVGNVAQPHMRQGDGNVVVRPDPQRIPASTSAAAGGIRCSLNDMLKWVSMWLHPDTRAPGSASAWITRAQRQELWGAHTPMPLPPRMRKWDGSRFNAYGYGWRLSDIDGALRVAHTGTLMGMYSAVTLLPELDAGFVFMINGEGSDARTVLNVVLARYFTAATDPRTVADYADALLEERRNRRGADPSLPVPARTFAAPDAMKNWLGVYSDPWFGEISICERGPGVFFDSSKSPLLAGAVMLAGERALVDWTDVSVDAEAWLDFSPGPAEGAVLLSLSRVDAQADFSYDYEDLHFSRVRDCH